ncbi:MAG: hypothetical protein HY552_00270 [Elusimicrobia bacterium]|nr:hypothetical protein [Elusimicrobiota bacterium]
MGKIARASVAVLLFTRSIAAGGFTTGPTYPLEIADIHSVIAYGGSDAASQVFPALAHSSLDGIALLPPTLPSVPSPSGFLNLYTGLARRLAAAKGELVAIHARNDLLLRPRTPALEFDDAAHVLPIDTAHWSGKSTVHRIAGDLEGLQRHITALLAERRGLAADARLREAYDSRPAQDLAVPAGVSFGVVVQMLHKARGWGSVERSPSETQMEAELTARLLAEDSHLAQAADDAERFALAYLLSRLLRASNGNGLASELQRILPQLKRRELRLLKAAYEGQQNPSPKIAGYLDKLIGD